MNKTYERYLRDEHFRAEIDAAARRARAEAVWHYLIEPLMALLRKAPPLRARPSRMLHRSA